MIYFPQLHFFISQFIQPINCILISEEVPTISIVLSERRSNSLKGELLFNGKSEGNFYTRKQQKGIPPNWSFEKGNIKIDGELILFKDINIWHPYQNQIKSYEVNKVLFAGLASKLSKNISNKDLLKATYGFFKIGNECYGGRINKV